MIIQQLYTNCLAQGAYYISHKGEAAIIDPLREPQPYLDLLKQNNDRLVYIFETHFHADFVSGHVDLAKATEARIVFGPGARTSYLSHSAADQEEFRIGGLTLRVIHTPGHTLESSCYLLLDEAKKPVCLFTGDTLFIGDVGRPDLAVKSALSQEDLAGMLYDSLREKILTLPDDIIVYPAHGAGSACGKNMSKETFDTLGNQKKVNYALQPMSKADFINELTSGILPAPQYFAKNVALNKNGYEDHDAVMKKGARALSPAEFSEASLAPGTIILDVRKPQEFASGFIPGALYIGLDGQFAPWVGTVILDLKAPILLVAPPGREEEAVLRLSRVGYDNCTGYLDGGMGSWIQAGQATEQISSIPAGEFFRHYAQGHVTLDVRKPGEFESSHLKNALSRPLDFIYEWMEQADPSTPYMIHCAGGYRSMIAASILRARGFQALTDVQGGYAAIRQLEQAQPETVALACSKSA